MFFIYLMYCNLLLLEFLWIAQVAPHLANEKLYKWTFSTLIVMLVVINYSYGFHIVIQPLLYQDLITFNEKCHSKSTLWIPRKLILIIHNFQKFSLAGTKKDKCTYVRFVCMWLLNFKILFCLDFYWNVTYVQITVCFIKVDKFSQTKHIHESKSRLINWTLSFSYKLPGALC